MEISKKVRYHLLDGIRGMVLVSMIAYHFSWNMVYLYGAKWSWYQSAGAYLWQQSICWTFILLSGFCWSMGRNHLKRGLLVFGGGALVTIVTLVVMPQNRVVFGVLTLIGSCMLLMIPLDKVLKKIPAEIGVLGSFGLFLITRNINRGCLGFENFNLVRLPREWYHGWFATYLGMPAADFYSTDYFSLIPWFFLFAVGYFIFKIFEKYGFLNWRYLQIKIPVFGWMGRHSLLIYLLHQPILYVGMKIFLR